METTFTFSDEQMEALNYAISKIRDAIHKLVEAVREWAENFKILLDQVFPSQETNKDLYRTETKKECSVKSFLMRIRSMPRRIWEKCIWRHSRHEADY